MLDRYVIIAPRRNSRPYELPDGTLETQHAATPAPCVFCPAEIDRARSLYHVGPALRRWKLKVVMNKFAAVTLDNPKAYGRQEVVIETPSHTKQLDNLSTSHIELLFRAYAERTLEIQRNKKIQYILVFKNSGGSAGASIQHSHSQIFATNFIPPHLLHRSQKAQEYVIRTGRCAYCDMIRVEEKSARRIYRDALISVFAPYASQNNYEVWILPRRHVDNVTMLHPEEREAFAGQLKGVLRKITKLHLPYNYYFHQVVNDRDQHLYIKIRPRGSVWAGLEVGSGVIINPIAPEAAARYYRS